MGKIEVEVGPYMVLTKADESGHVAVAIPKISSVEKCSHPSDVTKDFCIVTIENEKFNVKETFQTILTGLRKS